MSTGGDIQSHIDFMIKQDKIKQDTSTKEGGVIEATSTKEGEASENTWAKECQGSVNVYQLLKSDSSLESVTRSREELEKYYIKNYKDVKGFFFATFLTNHNQKLVSTVVDEHELHDISNDPLKSLQEVSICAICSLSKNFTSSDIKLALSNSDLLELHDISPSEVDAKEIQQTHAQSTVVIAPPINEINEKLKGASDGSKHVQSAAPHKRKIIDSDDEQMHEFDKRLKTGQAVQVIEKEDDKMEVEKCSQHHKSEENDDDNIDQDDTDDEQFIATHLKRTAAISTHSQSQNKKEEIVKSHPGSAKESSKSKGKAPPPVPNSKITQHI